MELKVAEILTRGLVSTEECPKCGHDLYGASSKIKSTIEFVKNNENIKEEYNLIDEEIKEIVDKELIEEYTQEVENPRSRRSWKAFAEASHLVFSKKDLSGDNWEFRQDNPLDSSYMYCQNCRTRLKFDGSGIVLHREEVS